MPRVKKRDPATWDVIKKEIIGITIVAISLIIGINMYIKPSGAVGIFANNFFKGIFGIGGLVFPVLIFATGVFIIIGKGQKKLSIRGIAVLLFLYCLLIIIHNSYSYAIKDKDILHRIMDAYSLGTHNKGGGIISELMCIILIYVFGDVGTYIVITCISLILIIIISQVSLGETIKKLGMKFIISLDNIKETIKTKRSNKTNTELKKSVNQEVDVPDAILNPVDRNIQSDPNRIKIFDFMNEKNDKKENLDIPVKSLTSNIKTDNSEKLESDITKEPLVESNIPQEKREYFFPPLTLLKENKDKSSGKDTKGLVNNARVIEETLQSFGVEAKVVEISRGPAVTRYELHPNAGVKISRIVNLADDIALNLAASGVRIEVPIPGKAAVGIEVPNKNVVAVGLREVLESSEFKNFKSNLAFALGKDISGKCIVTDISKMPHLLIAGATGSGKSVCINTLINSIIYKSSPDNVKLLLIDPKVVELSVYNGIPHLLVPVVTDPKKAASSLFWAVNEMTQRYKTFADNNVRNIESYNSMISLINPEAVMPQIIIIIDELADLMMVAPNEVEDNICRLAQMARAAGMHLVIATQRPSVDVITGVIKANIPSRISFAVSSQIDSRTILDMSGAEKLLGKGDMLFLPIGSNKPIRIQGAFISESEVEAVVEFLKNSVKVDYSSEIIDEIENQASGKESSAGDADDLLPEAIKISVESGQTSASMIQRRLRVGFNRAARLIEQMEERGIVGPQDGSKPRQVLMSKEQYESNV